MLCTLSWTPQELAAQTQSTKATVTRPIGRSARRDAQSSRSQRRERRASRRRGTPTRFTTLLFCAHASAVIQQLSIWLKANNAKPIPLSLKRSRHVSLASESLPETPLPTQPPRPPMPPTLCGSTLQPAPTSQRLPQPLPLCDGFVVPDDYVEFEAPRQHRRRLRRHDGTPVFEC